MHPRPPRLEWLGTSRVVAVTTSRAIAAGLVAVTFMPSVGQHHRMAWLLAQGSRLVDVLAGAAPAIFPDPAAVAAIHEYVETRRWCSSRKATAGGATIG